MTKTVADIAPKFPRSNLVRDRNTGWLTIKSKMPNGGVMTRNIWSQSRFGHVDQWRWIKVAGGARLASLRSDKAVGE